MKNHRLGLLGLLGVLAATLAIGCGGSSGTPARDGGDAGGGSGGSDASVGDAAAGDGAACPTGGGTGQLKAMVTAPDGMTVTPMLRVVGPGLSAPMLLSGGATATVPAGAGYVIEGRRVKVPPAAGGIVATAYYAKQTSFSGCVRAGETTTATVTYDKEPGSGRLWMSVVNSAVAGRALAAFDAAQLAATGTKAPVAAIGGSPNNPHTPVFDFNGNLWVTGSGVPEKIVMWKMERLGDSLSLPPDVELTGAALVPAHALAFDSQGNLWAARRTAGEVVRVPFASLAATGTPAPDVVLKSADLMAPAALAFDKDANLWVASQDNDKVLKFAAAKLTASGTVAADVALTAARLNAGGTVAYNFRSPQSLAFDRSGNLWAGFFTGNNIVRFTPAQLAASAQVGNPLEMVASVSALVTSLAFDESGGLWYPAAAGKVARIPAAMLAGTTGTLNATPDIVIDGGTNVGTAVKLAFDPAPAGLPFFDE